MSVTVNKLQLKLKLDNGNTAIINLPEAINNTLTDSDTGDELYGDAMASIKAAYATDDGATVNSGNFYIISTTTTEVAEDVGA